jgi:acyl-CoA synthetase (AMP-forming)/AMP-acid ligase II
VPTGISSADLKMPLAALFGQARKTLKATALIAAGQRWSAEQLAQRVEILAGSLRRKGVRPGDRVALHMLNIPELVVAYCACFGIGAIAVPLNARHNNLRLKGRGVASALESQDTETNAALTVRGEK